MKGLQGRFKGCHQDKKPQTHVSSEQVHVKPKAPCGKEKDIPAFPLEKMKIHLSVTIEL